MYMCLCIYMHIYSIRLVEDEYKYYLRFAETTFKERYNNHKSSFKNENSKNSTELLKYVGSLRENNKIPLIKWKIIKIVYSNANYV